MAVSGTISTTVFTTAKVIELALRRCKIPPQRISGEMVQLARDNLSLILSSLGAHGFKLWTTERVILDLEVGNPLVDTPPGTIEVRDVNLRSLQRQTGTATSATSTYQVAFTADLRIETVGVKFASGGTFSLVIERSSDGSSWSTALSIPSATYAVGVWYWFDVDAPAAADFIRIRETTGAAISVSDFYAGLNASEVPMAPLNRNTYASLPNKFFSGRPVQYWFNRQRDEAALRVWPTPSDDTLHIVAYRDRHIMDVGTLTQSLDIPQDWHEAIVAMLAYRMSKDAIEVDRSVAADLKADADEALFIAKSNQRSRADIIVDVGIACYTRVG